MLELAIRTAVESESDSASSGRAALGTIHIYTIQQTSSNSRVV